jgi:hypothetical protein
MTYHAVGLWVTRIIINIVTHRGSIPRWIFISTRKLNTPQLNSISNSPNTAGQSSFGYRSPRTPNNPRNAYGPQQGDSSLGTAVGSCESGGLATSEAATGGESACRGDTYIARAPGMLAVR